MGKSKRKRSSSSEYDWRTPIQIPSNSSKVDDNTSFNDLLSRVASSRPSKTAPHKEKEPVANALELNPYWKEYGTGLPSAGKEASKQSINSSNERWYLRAVQRAEEESRETGESVRHILLQRWSADIVDEMESKFSRPHQKMHHNRPRNSGQTNWKETTSALHNLNASEERTPVEQPFREERDEIQSNRVLTKDVVERYVTEDDINTMAAQLLKSELSGNNDKASKFKIKLEKLREAKRRNIKVRLSKTVSASSASASSSQKLVQLTTTNAKGLEVPLHLQDSSGRPSGSKYQRLESHDSRGNRISYLQEDSKNVSIDEMLRLERMESGKSSDLQFISMAGRCKYGAEDEYADAFVKNKSRNQEYARQKQKSDAVAEYKRKEYAETKCSFCLERVTRFLVMSIGQRMFLSLPEHASLTRGHCLLSPLEHAGAMTRVDEVAMEEAHAFKRALCRMAASETGWLGPRFSYVFLEVAAYPNAHRHHVQIECIPVDRDTMDELPSYFKKALLDLGSEWDQNKRVISLKNPGAGAHGAIPPNFGYFAVEFGHDGGGYAKVIEDWASFPLYFGREVLAGVLGKSTDKWRKPKRDSPEDLRRKTVEFEEHWSTQEGSVVGNGSMFSLADVKATGFEPEGPDLPPSMVP